MAAFWLTLATGALFGVLLVVMALALVMDYLFPERRRAGWRSLSSHPKWKRLPNR